MKKINIQDVLESFDITPELMEYREEVSQNIHSFSEIIIDRFLDEHKNFFYLSPLKPQQLKPLLEDYFCALYSQPLDSRLPERTYKLVQQCCSHTTTDLHIYSAFSKITDIIIDLSRVNLHMQKITKTLLKFLKLSEYLFIQAVSSSHAPSSIENNDIKYYKQLKNVYKIKTRAIKRLKESCESSISKEDIQRLLQEQEQIISIISDSSHSTRSTKQLFELVSKNIKVLKTYLHSPTPLDNTSIRTLLSTHKQIRNQLEKLLQNLDTGAYLSMDSSLKFIQELSYRLQSHTGMIKTHNSSKQQVKDEIYNQLNRAFGWAIEVLEVNFHKPRKGQFDYYDEIFVNDIAFYICISFEQSEEITLKEKIVSLMIEILKVTYIFKQREQTVSRLADRTEEINRTKDVFLANMSHELRTPLNAIIGFSQILTMQEGLSEKHKSFVEKIQISGNNLLSLVNTILDFAKLEAGKMLYKPELTKLSTILDEVKVLIEPQARQKSIYIDIPRYDDISIYMDAQLIKQVLINLLNNATKYTLTRGKIWLDIHLDEQRQMYLFSINDTGIGINKDDVKTLFHPFNQIDTQEKIQGTGLGLAISRKIVEDLHHGSIWIESEVGKGSSFKFLLPLNKDELFIKHLRCDKEEALHLLLIEDNSEYLDMMISHLHTSFNITATNSVNKAKKLLETEVFDFIILDFFLIDGIGSEILVFMNENFIQLPVMIISAEDERKILEKMESSDNVQAIFNKNDIDAILSLLKKAKVQTYE